MLDSNIDDTIDSLDWAVRRLTEQTNLVSLCLAVVERRQREVADTADFLPGYSEASILLAEASRLARKNMLEAAVSKLEAAVKILRSMAPNSADVNERAFSTDEE